MSTLPSPIAAYVEASNAQAPQRVAACFEATATVSDEHQQHQGRAQIEAWAADAAERYQAIMQPLGLEETDGAHLLRTSVSGDFPGSPVTLSFRFTLGQAGIAALEITP